MKKVVALVVVIFVVAAIVMTLQNNKAKSAAKSHHAEARPIAVSVVQAQRRPIDNAMSLVGTITAAREVSVASETMGRVVSVNAEIGDAKPTGALLVQIDDELKRTAVTMAQATFEKATRDFDRVKQVQTANAVPDQLIDNAAYAVQTAETQLITAKRQLRDARITVPFSGIVTSRFVEVGATVQPGTPIATIVDVSSLKLKVNVSEQDVITLRNGQSVEITTDVYPGVSFSGRIRNVSAKADEAHTYPVEINVSNRSDHPLKAGMFGRVAFNNESSRNALTIPRVAVVGSIRQAQVYVVESGVAKLRTVTLGNEVGNNIEVISGLSQAETVVVGGQNNLRDGASVEVMK